MEGSSSVVSCLGSLSSFIESHVAETDTHIEALKQTAKALVPPDEYDELAKATTSDSDFGKDALLVELERLRLELLMEIQQQDYVTLKLKELISESEELVQSVTDYCVDLKTHRANDEQTAKNHLEYYADVVVGGTTKQLQANTHELEEAMSKVPALVRDTLRSIMESRSRLLSEEYRQQLSKAIATLNKSFNAYANNA